MRRGVRIVLWVVLGPLVLLLAVALAWLAFNGPWADAPVRAVPAELQSQAVTLAPGDNAFFDIQGLAAPAGQSPNAWGQRAWRNVAPGEGAQLAMPSGGAWDCNALKADCVVQWRAAAPALAKQMADARTFGERCKTLAARPALQEPLPPAQKLPQFRGASQCLRWLQIEAVLAPDAQRAHPHWAQADALLRLMASGTQTLIGQAVTWTLATRHQLLLAQWAALQPAGDALAPGWLAPLPAQLLQPRVWMAAESSYQRAAFRSFRSAPEQMYSLEPNRLQAWASRLSLGLLPEAMEQASTAYWMADVDALGPLQGPALARAVRSRPAVEEGGGWPSLSWRNTLGQILVDVARPRNETYALRQADLVVQQAALAFSQQLSAVPAAGRAAWWAGQVIDAGIRERLSLEADALLVRTWRGEVDPEHKAPLRFPLRPT